MGPAPEKYQLHKYSSQFTVILQVAVFPPSTVFTVMVAVPFFFAVTRPVALTVATAGLLLVQVTALFEAFAGCGHAASWKV